MAPNIFKNTLLYLAFLASLAACSGSGFTPDADGGAVSRDSAISVYFSRPEATTAASYTGGLETQLVNAIDNARLSIDMAIYELSLDNLVQSLIDAHERGVDVRVYTDSDNLDWQAFVSLKTAGITIKGDGRSALMHNKFTVIDDAEVWTGSMNYTYYGAYRHNENLLRIRHVEAAANYAEEFEQLWQGIHNMPNAAATDFNIGAADVSVHFSPDDNIRANFLLPMLKQADSSVYVMAYSFTSDEIAAQLVALMQQGVEVKIVVDESTRNQQGAEYAALKAQGMDIHLDGNSHKLHHKVIIIDGQHVVTGSYNFTQSAETRNDENMVIIRNRTIAANFSAEFDKVYQQAITAGL